MKIGILQTGHAPDEIRDEQGDYDDMFRSLLGARGYEFITFNVVEGIFPSGPQDADAWLITGSKHGAYEDHPWIPPLEALIRDIKALGLPMIGVCFGHQIIAQALGGKVEKFSGGWAIGRHDYTINGANMSLNAWHQDQVVDLPEGAEVIGSNAFCANAALLIDGTILTIQPHPEFTADVIDGLIKYRSGTVPDALVKSARENLGSPTQSDKFGELMIAHLEKANRGDRS
ncbi:type 1 glutamine amidotransferase [Lentibacter algarum]|uniref:type 1 glutamine amidotransferase n=1 Tax=Lentibacter algarum TaxID=576131 RepID=UPI001C0A0A93|nr:type 1 glutamine amidotransferase [Lentibacter algarum]MBU2982760.1 type 1 glutamine amidotransferase [Lentibacter algarum]